VGGQELFGGHTVELGQPGELGHGDRAVSAFPGADGDHRPLPAGRVFDLLEAHPAFPSDGSQPRTQGNGVSLGHSQSPHSGCNTLSVLHAG